jgi:hypothetical protein
MKTKESTLKDMRRSLGSDPGFIFQYVGKAHFGWCTERSPLGDVCHKALLEGQASVLGSDGSPLKGFHGQGIIIHAVERVTA